MKTNSKNIKTDSSFFYIVILSFLIVFTGIQLCLYLHFFDVDIYFILFNGKDIALHGIPYEITGTVHDNMHTILQQWLTSLIEYKIFEIFGRIGLNIFVLCVSMLEMNILFRIIRLYNLSKRYTYIIMCLVYAMLKNYVCPRPQLYTLVLISLVVYISLLNDNELSNGNNKKYYWFLPIISILQINLHASMWWITMFVAGLFLVPNILDVSRKPKSVFAYLYDERKKISIFLISMLAGLINPYGFEAVLYLFNSVGTGTAYISEMVKPAICSGVGFVYLMELVFFVYVIIEKKRTNHTLIYLAIFSFAMGITAYRNLGLSAICFIPFWCESIKSGNTRCTGEKNNYKIPVVVLTALMIAILMVVFTPYRLAIKDDVNSPMKAQKYLDEKYSENKEDSRVFTFPESGSYLRYYGYNVYMYTSFEIFGKKINKQKDIMKELEDMFLYQNNADYQSFVERYDFTDLVVYKGSAFDFYLQSNDKYHCVLTGGEEKGRIYNLYEKIR